MPVELALMRPVFHSEMISLQEESSAVQSLKDEFTQRIAEAERKAQLACKERDIAKKVSIFLNCCFEFSYNPSLVLH